MTQCRPITDGKVLHHSELYTNLLQKKRRKQLDKKEQNWRENPWSIRGHRKIKNWEIEKVKAMKAFGKKKKKHRLHLHGCCTRKQSLKEQEAK